MSRLSLLAFGILFALAAASRGAEPPTLQDDLTALRGDWELVRPRDGLGAYRLQGDERTLDGRVELPLQQTSIELKGEGTRIPSRALSIRTPNGWYLNLSTDGSGRVGYGSGGGDSWPFKAGTFEVEKVTKTLEALKSDEKGKAGSHFVFGFESERQAPDMPGPSRYSRDDKVILPLFYQAIEAGEVKKQQRGRLLLEQRPPGLPNEK
jgi:hypothetical protein